MAESRVVLTEGAEALRAHAAASRVEALARHLGSAAAPGPSRAKSTTQAGAPPSFDDVLIIAAVRTPIGKARRGAFKDTTPDVLLATVLKEAQSRSGVPMHAIGDICVGEAGNAGRCCWCARGPGGGYVRQRRSASLEPSPRTHPPAPPLVPAPLQATFSTLAQGLT